jgi:protein subunit release factor A
VNSTLHQLDRVLDGDIDTIVDALATRQQEEQLRSTDEA